MSATRKSAVAIWRRRTGGAAHDTGVATVSLGGDAYAYRVIQPVGNGKFRRTQWALVSRESLVSLLAQRSRMDMWNGRAQALKDGIDEEVDWVPRYGLVELELEPHGGARFEQRERRRAMAVVDDDANLPVVPLQKPPGRDEGPLHPNQYRDRAQDILAALEEREAVVGQELWAPARAAQRPAPEAAPVVPAADPHGYPEILTENRRQCVQLERGRHFLRKLAGTGVTDVELLRTARESFSPVLLLGPAGTGKAVSLETPVLTPGGWVRAADVCVGDELVGSSGTPTRVVAVYPQPVMPMYRVTFSDGVQIDANGEHLWTVMTSDDRASGTSRVLTTDQIRARGSKRRLSVPTLSAPVEYDPQDELPMDPYALGVALGDGHITGHQAQIHTDLEILRAVGAASVGERPGCWFGTLQVPTELGLRGKRSWEKSIPHQYMTASPKDRIALLQGLLDTDGSPERGKSGIEFATASPVMAGQVQELVRSLGGTARASMRTPWYTYRGDRLIGRDSHRVRVKLPAGIPPFRLERKARLHVPPSKYPVRRYIDSIDPIDDAPSVCFTVDAPDSLFAVDGFVLTHNTQSVLAAFGEHNIITVLGHEEVEAASFEGRYTPKEGGGWKITLGKLVRAMQEGKVLFIDEIGLISPLVLSILYSAMDGRRSLEPTLIPDIGVVEAQPGFYVAGAANPGAPGSRITDAMRSRFPYRPVVGTDYRMAVSHLGVPEDIASAAANLEERRLARELSWAPQLRDLVQYVRAVEDFNEELALAALAGKAPDPDQRTVCEVLGREVGRTVKPLAVT